MDDVITGGADKLDQVIHRQLLVASTELVQTTMADHYGLDTWQRRRQGTQCKHLTIGKTFIYVKLTVSKISF